MLFRYYSDYLNYSNQLFIQQAIVAIGALSVTHIDNFEFPYSSSACDHSRLISLKKLYSEHIERSRLSYIYGDEDKIAYVNLLDETINYISKSSLTYGTNSDIGYVDSTGTAFHPNSSQLSIKKAISELIEKNELLLFWYLELGEKIDVEDPMIKKIIDDFNLSEYEIFLFKVQNISSWFTVVGVMFQNGKIISSGISCHEELKKALICAITELKIIRVLNSFTYFNVFPKHRDFNAKLYQKIKKFNFKKTLIGKRKEIQKYNLGLNKEIQNLNVAFISNNKNYGVVSAFSDSLIKCLPTKQNLELCKNIPIVQNNREFIFNSELDCVIV